jgi:protein-glutamine gamma-glutamyltransferase
MIRNAVDPANRFFQLSILGLVTTGYFAVLGSGYLGFSAALLVAAGLGVRAASDLGIVRLEIPRWLVSALTLTYMAFYGVDWLFLSKDFVRATVHLVFFLAVVKVITATTNRDFAYLIVVAFLELLAAALLSSNLNFFAFLALFLLFLVATFMSAEVRRGASRSHRVARAGMRLLPFRLAVLTGVVSLSILVFTALLFFFLPRTARAAFQHLVPQQYHLPGFSNEVLLGQIGEFQQSKMPVMRVRLFNGETPGNLKWRGAALTDFDGRRWSNAADRGTHLRLENGRLILASDDQRRREGRRIGYEVQLRSVASDALFFAGTPEFVQIGVPTLVRTNTGAYRIPFGSTDGLRYGAFSYVEGDAANPALVAYADLDYSERSASLRLPPNLDSRIPALARGLTQQYPSPADQARAIELHLRRNYRYSTELLSQQVPSPLAHFLFERRQGHCEYFASAMAVMLRSVGIPARLATGFQSGEWNPVSGWQVIRASDAHSWVEAYVPGQGWLVYDPTPPAPAVSGVSLVSRLRIYMDAAETFWQDWVLNYSLEQQIALAARVEEGTHSIGFQGLSRLGEGIRGLRQTLASAFEERGPWMLGGMLAATGLSLSLWQGRSLWRHRRRVEKARRGKAGPHDATILYLRMLAILEASGYQRPAWVTPSEFVAQLRASPSAELAAQFTEAYNQLRFGGRREAAAHMTVLLEQLEAARRETRV